MMATFRTSQPVFAPDESLPHIVLVGLPGAGKSTVGQRAAEALTRPFLDLDLEIERREAMPVTQIFAERGEHHFRALERSLTEELRTTGGMVLSPGGGWITNPDNPALLRPPATIIYLRTRPETALQRLGPDRSTRPLLQRPDPLAEFRKLFDARKELYEMADHTIDTDPLSLEAVVNKVCELARRPGTA